jgi:hypothetical protein
VPGQPCALGNRCGTSTTPSGKIGLGHRASRSAAFVRGL